MPDMTEFFGVRAVFGLVVATVIAGGTFLSQTCFSAEPGAASFAADPIVVVDPGHGGPDQGAAGDNGLVEKKIALSLAEALGSLTDRGYKARLTRTGDYHVDLVRRTGTANHLKADLFISIHVGGSYLRQTQGSTVYYFEADRQAGSTNGDPQYSQGDAIPWEKVQDRHQENSKRLAETIKGHLDALSPETENNCRIISAPLAVLAGADMPAVLVEIGYIRNLHDIKRFSDDKKVAATAATIADAIADFLHHKQP